MAHAHLDERVRSARGHARRDRDERARRFEREGAHEASPPRDLAVSGATSVSSLETNEAFFGIPESAPAAGPACAFENWRDAALRSWYADAMSGLLFRSGSTLA